jgi:hypothetical protein
MLGLGVNRVHRRHDQHIQCADRIAVLDTPGEAAFLEEDANDLALDVGLVDGRLPLYRKNKFTPPRFPSCGHSPRPWK